jgi:glycosyltransferase involved in cell wall biosynthesis
MKISVIIPIYLGRYSTAAKDLENKLFRAINSVTNQSYKDVEAICVIDSCARASEVLTQRKGDIEHPDKVKIYELQYNKYQLNKFVFNACHARNSGISVAGGDIVCYLDIDDYLTYDHVEKIVNNFIGLWVYFDNWLLNTKKNEWYRDIPNVNQQFKCGTCNIAHVKDVKAMWRNPKYGHDDWTFITQLKHESEGKYIGESGYRVCHWHNPKYDV